MKKILEISFIYQLWQAPFIRQKLRPYLNNKTTSRNLCVVELGCGPGTNAALFSDSNYYGFDLSPEYIATARRLHPEQTFFVADVGNDSWLELLWSRGVFEVDLIFINSLLHHLDDMTLNIMLLNCSKVLSETGVIHITDLILPDRYGIPKFLARADRGDYPRRECQWLNILSKEFKQKIFLTFYLKLFGLNLWHMFYFKGFSNINKESLDDKQ